LNVHNGSELKRRKSVLGVSGKGEGYGEEGWERELGRLQYVLEKGWGA
jgi:hypothetical protein